MARALFGRSTTAGPSASVSKLLLGELDKSAFEVSGRVDARAPGNKQK